MEEKTLGENCPFFDICAAYIIREKLEGCNRYETGERRKKWSERFCFTDFTECVHHRDRIQIDTLIEKP